MVGGGRVTTVAQLTARVPMLEACRGTWFSPVLGWLPAAVREGVEDQTDPERNSQQQLDVMQVKLAELRLAHLLKHLVDANFEILGTMNQLGDAIQVWVDHQVSLLGSWPTPLDSWPPLVSDPWAPRQEDVNLAPRAGVHDMASQVGIPRTRYALGVPPESLIGTRLPAEAAQWRVQPASEQTWLYRVQTVTAHVLRAPLASFLLMTDGRKAQDYLDATAAASGSNSIGSLSGT